MPKVYSVTPNTGAVGTSVAVTGTGFHGTADNNTVSFNGTNAAATSLAQTASNETLTVAVPTGAATGQLLVAVNGQNSNTHYDWSPYGQIIFTVSGSVVTGVTGITPSSGEQGQTMNVTISGAGVAWSGDMKSAVHFSNSDITINSATGSGTSISANISISNSATISAGTVTVDGANGSAAFAVTVRGEGPVIDTISPDKAPAGIKITATGMRFGASRGQSTLVFENNDTHATYPVSVISWSDTAIEAIVPALAPRGRYTLKVVKIEITAANEMRAFESNDAAFEVTASSGTGATIYPNPFNPLATGLTASGMAANQATIAYDANGAANVGIYIYDTTARLVYHAASVGGQITWNGCDMQGEHVADGVYLLRVVNEENKALISKGRILVVKQ
jgi:hypothetical protein